MAKRVATLGLAVSWLVLGGTKLAAPDMVAYMSLGIEWSIPVGLVKAAYDTVAIVEVVVGVGLLLPSARSPSLWLSCSFGG